MKLRNIRGEMSALVFGKMFAQKPQNIYRYEKGHRKPPLEFLKEVASYANVSLDWLMSEESEENDKNFSESQGKKDECPQPVWHTGNKLSNISSMDTVLAALVSKLDECEKERREIATENRHLHNKVEQLLRENGDLKAEIATLRMRRDAGIGGGEEIGGIATNGNPTSETA